MVKKVVDAADVARSQNTLRSTAATEDRRLTAVDVSQLHKLQTEIDGVTAKVMAATAGNYHHTTAIAKAASQAISAATAFIGVDVQAEEKSRHLQRLMSRLEKSAVAINSVSDNLNDQISAIDGALKKLSLGVPAWVRIKLEDDSESGYIYIEELGYCKLGSKWGIALKTHEADMNGPDGVEEEVWAFAQAPRELRMRAIEHIPALLEEVCAQTEITVAKLSSGVEAVQQLAAAFTSKEAK